MTRRRLFDWLVEEAAGAGISGGRREAILALLVPDDIAFPAVLAAAPQPRPCLPVAGPVVRVSVTVVRTDTRDAVLDNHIRARIPSPDPWPDLADVITGSNERGQSRRNSFTSVAALAHRHPGALVVAGSGSPKCPIVLCGQLLLGLRVHDSKLAAADLPWPVWTSLIHAWLVAGLPPVALAASSAHAIQLAGCAGAVGRQQGVLLRQER